MSTPEVNELFRFENIAYDVGMNFGNTSAQSLARMRRLVNRAMFRIVSNDRQWSWLTTKDSFNTVASQEEYSLRSDVNGWPHMLWLEGANRQKLERIPSTKFRELVPNPTDDSGTPRLYDFNGVDSQGAKILTLYPIPSGVITVYYRFTRQVKPLYDGGKDVRSYWGLPENMVEILIEMATALSFKGINDDRYAEQIMEAEALVQNAYASDQKFNDTTYRAPMFEINPYNDDGAVLEPRFGV